MSGFLGKCTIPKYGSVLLYENTTDGPASVTIGSQVDSNTQNACISIKVDDTDNTLQECSVLHDSVVSSNEFQYLNLDNDGIYCGQTYLNNYTPGYSLYKPDNTTEENYISQCKAPLLIGLACLMPPNGWPTDGCDYCVNHTYYDNNCGCSYNCLTCNYRIAASFNPQRYRYNIPSFSAPSAVCHFEKIREESDSPWILIPAYYCDPSCDNMGSYDFIDYNCIKNLSNYEKQKCFLKGVDKTDCTQVYCSCCDFVSTCAAFMGADIWSVNPSVISYEFSCCDSCPGCSYPGCIRSLPRFCITSIPSCSSYPLKSSVSTSCSAYASNYCSCYSSLGVVFRCTSPHNQCINTWWDGMSDCSKIGHCSYYALTHPAQNPIIGFCGAIFAGNYRTEYGPETFMYNIIPTNSFCYCCNNPECGECRKTASNWMSPLCSCCEARKQGIYTPLLRGGRIIWGTYDPYNKRNVFMLHNNCGASGYYTFDAEKANDAFFSCKPACFGCCCCCGGCVAVCTNNASSMAEYGIEKIGEFTNPESPLENRCSYDEQLQITLPPYQIDDECWIIFTQCYLPGTISCWNGCMKKYVSHDLITWCEPTGEIDDYYINTNEGDRSLITVDTTNSIINKKTDYFFNKECIGNQGLIEYNTSANQYERTGLVIGSGDKVWVADDSGNSDIPVQIWGYEE